MDYLESLPYGCLQKMAKKFKIRANQKATKLRKCLLLYADDIKLQIIEETGQTLHTSTPTRLKGKRDEDCNDLETSYTLTQEQSVNLTIRTSSPKKDVDLLNSFEKRLITCESSPNNEADVYVGENFNQNEATEPQETCHEPDDEKRLNETYSLSPSDDSMKENISPEVPIPPIVHQTDGNSSIIVIEEENDFFIYENCDNVDPMTSKTSNQQFNLKTEKDFGEAPETDSQTSASIPQKNSAKANPAVTNPKRTPNVRLTSSKPSVAKITKSASRVPNFKLIHQRHFAKMESIADFQNRRNLLPCQENPLPSKIPHLKTSTLLKPSCVAPAKKECQTGRVNKPTSSGGTLPKGILTSNGANIKHHSSQKSSTLVSKQMPMSAYNEKRKQALPSKSSGKAPPSKRMKLEGQSGSHTPSWKN